MTPFVRTLVAAPEDIDELGHVNNAVWVRWVQDMATAHWHALADPAHVARYVWVVVRHEIDYRGNLVAGERVEARTWVEGRPRGARFDRRVDFARDGRVIVAALSTWAMIDRDARRAVRIADEVSAPFLR